MQQASQNPCRTMTANPNEILAQSRFLMACEEYDDMIQEDDMPQIKTIKDIHNYFDVYFDD
ncbi:MAG: hypothetical protein ACI9TY_000341 [Alphaproteobacteria bacterium]|jgi:hypothetical protein